MLHDPRVGANLVHSMDAAHLNAMPAMPQGQRLRPVKIVDPAYELYCNLLLNGVWAHRAPHANRPTPPKRKYAWALQLAPA
jgi:hypothetical protein